MRIITATRRAALAIAVTMLATVGAAQAAVVHGTVVHRNARAHSFVVATRAGHLYAIHSARRPRPATVVTVSVRRLRNGTYAARRTHVLAFRRHARVRLRGTVSYLDRRHGTFTLSARGVSMLVRMRHGRLARVADALPPVGTIVTATGTVDDQGDLNDDTIQPTGTDTGSFHIEGAILAVDSTARTITVSSTDDGQTANSIVVSVPASLDISMFSVGQEVELQVSPQPDGSYVLAGSSSDEGTHGADSPGDQQGSQGDGHSGSGGSDGSGGSGGSSGSDSGSPSSGGSGGSPGGD
ncbi:MAG: hypothetical protein M3016_05085 [Actinomycetota bacterium]|nr:hypothetical protein [Actinomycetota bacterium]